MTLSYSGFLPSSFVTDPELLYGHNLPGALLDEVAMYASNGTNTQVLGERRAGKTSLIKCCNNKISKEAPSLIQVYLNYREHSYIKGRAEAIKYLLANVHAAVVAQGMLPPGQALTLKGVSFSNTAFPEEIYEQLRPVEHSYQVDGLLREYILQFVPGLNAGVVLYLDEYEHMLLNTFEAEAGAFFLLRDLSSVPKRNEAGGLKPLTIIIAGATIWDKLCGNIGSPELNNIAAVSYVHPVDLASFRSMWEHCAGHSSEDVIRRIETSPVSVEDAYALTGGWPFYGKIVGQQLSVGHSDVDSLYQALYQHFNVIWSRLTEQEQQVTKSGVIETVQSSLVKHLMRLGLLEEGEDGTVKPRGGLWRRFVAEASLREPTSASKGTELLGPQRERMRLHCEEIQELIYEINRDSYLSAKQYVFILTNQYHEILRDLKKLAINDDSFSQFARALYKLVFESTTGVREDGHAKPLERLPKKFRRSNKIVRVVDSIRHHFGGAHVTDLPTFNKSGEGMPVEDVLERYLGSKRHPVDDQFIRLQSAITQDVIILLRELRSHLFPG
jgi:hypothetical protein